MVKVLHLSVPYLVAGVAELFYHCLYPHIRAKYRKVVTAIMQSMNCHCFSSQDFDKDMD